MCFLRIILLCIQFWPFLWTKGWNFRKTLQKCCTFSQFSQIMSILYRKKWHNEKTNTIFVFSRSKYPHKHSFCNSFTWIFKICFFRWFSKAKKPKKVKTWKLRISRVEMTKWKNQSHIRVQQVKISWLTPLSLLFCLRSRNSLFSVFFLALKNQWKK